MHGPEVQYLDQESDLLTPDSRRSINFTVNMIWRWPLRFFVVFGIVALVGCPSLFVTQRLYRAQAIVMVGNPIRWPANRLSGSGVRRSWMSMAKSS
jgi:uncharacterized protein involved in exopolysaccharide biosynthesis